MLLINLIIYINIKYYLSYYLLNIININNIDYYLNVIKGVFYLMI